MNGKTEKQRIIDQIVKNNKGSELLLATFIWVIGCCLVFFDGLLGGVGDN